jgi:hypothetical protein
MGKGRVVHRILVGKPEGRRTLGRPRRRWEDNIKMGPDGAGSGKGQVAGTCEYGNELSVSINAGNFLTRYKSS